MATAVETVTPADVHDAAQELVRRVETVIEAKAAAVEQVMMLQQIVYKPEWPRFYLPIVGQVDAIVSDLEETETDESTLTEVREFAALIELAMEPSGPDLTKLKAVVAN